MSVFGTWKRSMNYNKSNNSYNDFDDSYTSNNSINYKNNNFYSPHTNFEPKINYQKNKNLNNGSNNHNYNLHVNHSNVNYLNSLQNQKIGSFVENRNFPTYKTRGNTDTLGRTQLYDNTQQQYFHNSSKFTNNSNINFDNLHSLNNKIHSNNSFKHKNESHIKRLNYNNDTPSINKANDNTQNMTLNSLYPQNNNINILNKTIPNDKNNYKDIAFKHNYVSTKNPNIQLNTSNNTKKIVTKNNSMKHQGIVLKSAATRSKQIVGNYELSSTLGKGTFAKVKLATHLPTKKKVAIKIIDKLQLVKSDVIKVYREIQIMKTLNHPNIVKLYQVIEERPMIYIVMEYADKGEIFDYIVSKVKLTEEDAKRKFRQLLSAVEYCHRNNIVHRDLKVENLLLDGKGQVKICDFGFSNHFKASSLLDTFCGSPPYAAPELFKGERYVGPEVDVWSLGVVFFTFLTGTLPFDGKTLQELKSKVLDGRFRTPHYVSVQAEVLLRRFLRSKPRERITLEQALKDEWLNKGYSRTPRFSSDASPDDVNEATLDKMEKMGYQRKEVTDTVVGRTFNHLHATYLLLNEDEPFLSPNKPNKPTPVPSDNNIRDTYGLQREQLQETARISDPASKRDLTLAKETAETTNKSSGNDVKEKEFTIEDSTFDAILSLLPPESGVEASQPSADRFGSLLKSPTKASPSPKIIQRQISELSQSTQKSIPQRYDTPTKPETLRRPFSSFKLPPLPSNFPTKCFPKTALHSESVQATHHNSTSQPAPTPVIEAEGVCDDKDFLFDYSTLPKLPPKLKINTVRHSDSLKSKPVMRSSSFGMAATIISTTPLPAHNNQNLNSINTHKQSEKPQVLRCRSFNQSIPVKPVPIREPIPKRKDSFKDSISKFFNSAVTAEQNMPQHIRRNSFASPKVVLNQPEIYRPSAASTHSGVVHRQTVPQLPGNASKFTHIFASLKKTFQQKMEDTPVKYTKNEIYRPLSPSPLISLNYNDGAYSKINKINDNNNNKNNIKNNNSKTNNKNNVNKNKNSNNNMSHYQISDSNSVNKTNDDNNNLILTSRSNRSNNISNGSFKGSTTPSENSDNNHKTINKNTSETFNNDNYNNNNSFINTDSFDNNNFSNNMNVDKGKNQSVNISKNNNNNETNVKDPAMVNSNNTISGTTTANNTTLNSVTYNNNSYNVSHTFPTRQNPLAILLSNVFKRK